MLKEDANTNYSHGQTPYKDFERVDFDCRGQTFQTCMSALKSNNTRCVVLPLHIQLIACVHAYKLVLSAYFAIAS